MRDQEEKDGVARPHSKDARPSIAKVDAVQLVSYLRPVVQEECVTIKRYIRSRS